MKCNTMRSIERKNTDKERMCGERYNYIKGMVVYNKFDNVNVINNVLNGQK